MKCKSKYLSAATVGCVGIIMITDAQTMTGAALEGVELCLYTVLPSLFPLIFITSYFASLLWEIPKIRLSFLAQLLGVPPGCEKTFLIGSISGYPVGAKLVNDQYKNGLIDKDNAERMLGFCNNAGPAFLFGILGPMFPSPKYIWYLWLIQIISALICAFTLPRFPSKQEVILPTGRRSLSDSLVQSIRVIANICGWVILFRVVSTYIYKSILSYAPTIVKVLILGLIELTNGCVALSTLDNISLRFIVCSCILAAGGCCIFLQTISVTKGLNPKNYVLGKFIQTLSSCLLSVTTAYIGPVCLILFPCVILLLRNYVYQKNNSGKLQINNI